MDLSAAVATSSNILNKLKEGGGGGDKKKFAQVFFLILVCVILYEISTQYVWKENITSMSTVTVYCIITWSIFVVIALLISFM